MKIELTPEQEQEYLENERLMSQYMLDNIHNFSEEEKNEAKKKVLQMLKDDLYMAQEEIAEYLRRVEENEEENTEE